MSNIAKQREIFGQIGAACVELLRGCEYAQLTELGIDQWGYLEGALEEMLANVKKARENAMSSINSALDHDGDTQPANAPPTPELCKCGHLEREHMPPLHHPGDVLRTGRNICCLCECERFER